jgi:predicted Zn-dependent protease
MKRIELKKIAHAALDFTPASEAACEVVRSRALTTRFADNGIIQNVSQENFYVNISASVGKKSAMVSTNQTDRHELAAAGERAVELAKISPPDPEYMPPLGMQKYPRVSGACARTASYSPAAMAAAVKKAAALAAKNRASASGTFVISSYEIAMMNKNGLKTDFEMTQAAFTTTMTLPDSTGWAEAEDKDVAKIEPLDCAKTALEKAKMSRHPKALEPGAYTVILEPAAVAEFVQFGFYYLGDRRAADEGRSFASANLGKRVGRPEITIYSAPAELNMSPWGRERMPIARNLWIEKGILKNVPTYRYWAKKKRLKPMDFSGSISIQGGKTSVDEMVRSTKKGLLVTRFWYIRSVEQMKLLQTGMSRDGVFLVEDGKIKHGVKNMRFNESLPNFLENVAAIGPAKCIDGVLAPPMKIDNFHFTSGTKF